MRKTPKRHYCDLYEMNRCSGCRECILLEVYTTVRELAERSLLLDLGSLSGILLKLSVLMFCRMRQRKRISYSRIRRQPS